MEVSNVEFTEPRNGDDRRLVAFVRFVMWGEVVVRECRLIRKDGGRGGVFLAFPDKARFVRCGACDGKVQFPDKYCRHCGVIRPPAAPEDCQFFSDCHPINPGVRQEIEAAVLAEYEAWRRGQRPASTFAGRRQAVAS